MQMNLNHNPNRHNNLDVTNIIEFIKQGYMELCYGHVLHMGQTDTQLSWLLITQCSGHTQNPLYKNL